MLCDDHVFWPKTFLANILAPFENAEVGCVGTNKRVRRIPPGFSIASFSNFIACLYLERHNFEIAATNTIDGGVFVVSGRTSAYRSEILQSQAFRTAFVTEHILFGLIGPLNADDDNFLTRWVVKHGYKIKIQCTEGACIETTLGEYPKFHYQCIRWAQTTWRSNPRSLLLPQVWQTQPWCIYAVYITSFVNFALFYDSAMLYTLWSYLSTANEPHFLTPSTGVSLLCLWIFGTKLVKPWPHFRRYPRDLVFLPGYILFGYAHSLVKLWALLTFWDISWGSRRLSDGTGGDLAPTGEDMQGGTELSGGVNGQDLEASLDE